jgi:hypothetical protein
MSRLVVTLILAATCAAQEPAADPFIERARAAVAMLAGSLPNYAVRQETKRAMQVGGRLTWTEQDHYSAELLYQNGRERIHNLRLNGKPADEKTVQAAGAWSTGQFGGLLEGIFAPVARAAFGKPRSGKLRDRAVWIYNYSVEKERSGWELKHAGVSHMSAFEGTVWIDQETAQTLRFVMRSRRLPVEFPLEQAETSTDYKMVRIGNGEFLLPVSSVAIVCARGQAMPRGRGPALGGRYCGRNTIEFTGYRQFGVESNIAFP